jgi:hypothetical protein
MKQYAVKVALATQEINNMEQKVILEGKVIEPEQRTEQVNFFLGHIVEIEEEINKLKRQLDRLTFAKVLATSEVFAKIEEQSKADKQEEA